ncbi:hypothetical protein L2E82_07184 [Cichorium intybus]|uniref:Uncharacterized protein n=1 Tax=Cichorium intybus TaxID=13427 RepID=A0ACB9G4L5_CICIN|nr:hypothetical protein L2E82_07184 [Cichorium intybus]
MQSPHPNITSFYVSVQLLGVIGYYYTEYTPFQFVILAYHIRVLDLDRLNPKSQNFALISTALISENSDS